MYGKVVNGEIVYAPYNYKLSDGTLIIGFNTNEELMMRYGYKEIVEHEVDYDPNTEELYNQYNELMNRNVTCVPEQDANLLNDTEYNYYDHFNL